MTIVVAGGGFAGVETIAAINDFLRDAVPFYKNLEERDLRIVLVHSGVLLTRNRRHFERVAGLRIAAVSAQQDT